MTRRARLVAAPLVGVLVGLALGRSYWVRHHPPTATGDRAEPYAVRTQEIMATPITVEAPTGQIDRAAAIVFDTFRRVDAEMSEWKDTSPLSAVNRNAGLGPTPVPDELRAVVARAIEIGDQTDGAFDLTWAAMWGLWDFKAQPPRVPTDAEITARLALIDYTAVLVDDDAGTVALPRAGMLIGLGGIAKGYALDQAAAALRGAGINSFLLSAGGQIVVGDPRADGSPPGGAARPWRVGIRDPRGPGDDSFATLDLTNSGVSTTGDYERSFILDGVRYHHVLDPRTGRPSHGVRAVSVVSPDATLADALSTALMILGVERGMKLVESLDGVEAVFIDDLGAVHVSAGLAVALTIVHEPRPGE